MQIPPKEEVRKDDQIKDGVVHHNLGADPLCLFRLQLTNNEAYGSPNTHRAIVIQYSDQERTEGFGCGHSQRDINDTDRFRFEG